MLMGYDEDGEGIPSSFASAFDTGHVDEDLMEHFTFTATQEISSALAGCSYEQELIAALSRSDVTQFGELANCAVLIFHFRHAAASGIRRTFSSVELTFMGAFKVAELYHGEP